MAGHPPAQQAPQAGGLDSVRRAAARMLAQATSRCRYTYPGAWVSLVFAGLSFTPSLLPRPAAFQGAIAGIDAAIGYGLGVLGAWIWREFADRPARVPSRRQWRVFAGVAAGGLLVALLLGLRWYRLSSDLVNQEPEGWLTTVLVAPVVGVLVFVALVALGRALRTGYRKLSALLDRWMGARAARALGLVISATLAILVLNGALYDGVIASVDKASSVRDFTTPEGTQEPETGLRSGGPGSLMDWDELGFEGRRFTGQGPNAGEISELTGRPALDPIRVYAGIAGGGSTEERAALAVRELERAGGFERANLFVATPSGTGWIEPSSIASFEYLTGGDSAAISMQYSHLPSWVAFLVDQQRARATGRELFDAIYEHWLALPVNDRPKLYVFGESLGSFGAETAFSGEFDLTNRTDGVLFAGPPNFNPLYRSFVDDRDEGSREVEPVYREGRAVRFTNWPRDGIPPADRPWGSPRVLYMQHPSDPIVWWSPDLMLQRPDWLAEKRGADVLGSMQWLPVVTFWQVSGDLALGFSTEPGHGHNYVGEHVDGWAEILQPAGWSADQLEELRTFIRAGEHLHPFTATSPETE